MPTSTGNREQGSLRNRAGPVAKMLAAGTIDWVLALCPDEPLAGVDDIERKWMTAEEHAAWRRWAASLRLQFPGFQAAYWKREHMKFGRSRGPLQDCGLPNHGAPLAEFVRARISHAKALWSRDVAARWTDLQFRDWLRLHVNGETWISPLRPDETDWAEALEVLRLAFGFPCHAPACDWKLCPPPSRRTR